MFKLFAHVQSKESKEKVCFNSQESIDQKQSNQQVCFKTSLEETVMLWHNKYGHLNFTGLNLFQQKEMVIGLPQLSASIKVCGDCLTGKQ